MAFQLISQQIIEHHACCPQDTYNLDSEYFPNPSKRSFHVELRYLPSLIGRALGSEEVLDVTIIIIMIIITLAFEISC